MNVTIRLNVLGVELATINVDLDLLDDPAPVAAVEKAAKRPVKWISRLWVKGMTA
ncbi:hypothetical protein SEA_OMNICRITICAL_62 [Mycobacterium phage OmniCritical]|uniref:Uncharacterized protein n=4 Tax=Fionnbharthvirus TaxID=2948708 RepID=A0A1J0MDT0_9CAUD|nr:hypothetical protein PBI_CHEETOBRO_63 [Mycobacterium phage Cheetobro]YP_009950498.1 hypothetical protein I5G70_gp71 [Mycobacterium phage Taquito]ALA46334.1 hypothetical protein PBI_SLARP_63 [Mycobacterium phage Slarp]APD19190.1 hypothetical protein SEA_MITTI_63 [Mycobacterium phage Mitti]ASR87770.1 hypothetical protein WINTERMUTE_63 [Mycobacterium phage Wintermute]ASW31704.1 hypothetical protein SEA_CHANCELLOR_63 [Mycobacterium phage Chancellor]AVR77376.1 hypothetical protein SEA_SAMSCHEPP